MNRLSKPLPDPDDQRTAPFWAGTRRHELVIQRCPVCAYLRWPPGPVCPECLTSGGVWTTIRPTGSLWSIAEYHRAFDPAFAGDVPYTVGLIQLDDGPRMYGTMQGELGSFGPGQRVRAVFVDVAPAVTLIHWETVSEGSNQARSDMVGRCARI